MMEQRKGLSGSFVIIGIISILVLMVIPIPPSLMDVMLALNITLSILIIMVAMYINEPLQFSVFPSLLLVVTLFRLSLNIASTRLILGEGYAGEVIKAFGTFVVKGNYVLGFIIFLILILINFVVITKGAGRVAEVAARFTLDAMPGKQMSIDADLNAGIIDEVEARRRREAIAREADFYGAMDGASKFVRGDAIAGLIITLVNIIGGFIIGVVQNGMTFKTAIQTYTLLTVGDGLVTQIPALLISTSAGIVVTRTATTDDMGQTILQQLFNNPKALATAAFVIFFFALAPGLPFLPFLLLAVVTGVISASRRNALKREREIKEIKKEEVEELPPPQEDIQDYLHVDPLELEIGYGLIPLVDEASGGDLLKRITTLRKQFAAEMGIIIPPIRIRDNLQMNANEYLIRIRGNEVAHGEIMADRYLAINPGTAEEKIQGIETKDPTFGLPAYWITPDLKDAAETRGYTVVEPEAVLATHLMEVLRNNAAQLLSREDVQKLINIVKEENPTVVEELIPAQLTVGSVQKVLQNLAKERIPIKDMVTILETLADFAPQTKDIDTLTELVRGRLSETITQLFKEEDGKIYGLTISPELEQILQEGAESFAGQRTGLGVEPGIIQRIYDQVAEYFEKMNAEGHQLIIFTAPQIRSYLRKMLEPVFPHAVVLSYGEISNSVIMQSLGTIGV